MIVSFHHNAILFGLKYDGQKHLEISVLSSEEVVARAEIDHQLETIDWCTFEDGEEVFEGSSATMYYDYVRDQDNILGLAYWLANATFD